MSLQVDLYEPEICLNLFSTLYTMTNSCLVPLALPWNHWRALPVLYLYRSLKGILFGITTGVLFARCHPPLQLLINTTPMLPHMQVVIGSRPSTSPPALPEFN